MIECRDCEDNLKYADKLEETIQGQSMAIKWLEEENENLKKAIKEFIEDNEMDEDRGYVDLNPLRKALDEIK